jgi:hypothetical protein
MTRGERANLSAPELDLNRLLSLQWDILVGMHTLFICIGRHSKNWPQLLFWHYEMDPCLPLIYNRDESRVVAAIVLNNHLYVSTHDQNNNVMISL